MKKATIALGLAGCLVVGAFGVGAMKKRQGSPPRAAPSGTATAKDRVATPLEAGDLVYDGKLIAGWDDWGWGPHKLDEGPAQVVFSNYGGILFHHSELPGQSPYGGVAFRFKAPAAFGDFLHVSLRGQGAPDSAFPTVKLERRHVARLAEGWSEALVDMSELNPNKQGFDRLMIGSYKPVAEDWVLLDKVMLTRGAGVPPTATTQTKPLTVSCKGGHPISALIYGASSDAWPSGISAKRIGGNTLTRSNWELGTWNAGNDWFFENTGQPQTMFQTVDQLAKEGRTLALVVPTIGWVAKDKTSVGFPRSLFKEQQKFDPYKAEAGNGLLPNGDKIAPGPPEQTSVAAPPALIKAWVQKLIAQDAARGSRSVHMYILDNEPALWNVTHRDVHPDPVGYDELLARTIDYATAIREADPQAVIAGPAEWGWTNYTESAKDRDAPLKNKPDRSAHGNVPLVAWFLQKLAEHEKSTGKRLLDVLDLHFYPQGDLFGGGAGTDPATAARRVRSTRALWDETYRDESWINEVVRLIPRMKEWVRENYPGTKLSLGEWNFGADEHISGGLATAEALGRFGQHGLDAAFFYGDLKIGTPSYWAFRAFRNFDGRGARFLDNSLPAGSSDELSVFASADTNGSKVVLVILNRADAPRPGTTIALDDCSGFSAARVFSYAANSKQLSPGKAALGESRVTLDLAPLSIAVVELSTKQAPSP